MTERMKNQTVECVIRPSMLCPLGQLPPAPLPRPPLPPGNGDHDAHFNAWQSELPSRRWYQLSLDQARASFCAA